ncbi:MAG TPA: hypothetical protein VML95_01280 [Longimicrobiales bacterium]|nr:hypothetical protein [Longimicrobiales bacterium]
MRCAPIFLLSVLSAPAVLAAQESARERCPWQGPEPATIGILRLLCRGGSCSINLEEDGGLAHRFSTEPVIQELAADAPAELAEGDVIVQVDGALITTREGGRRLARLRVETPITLRLRRGGREFDARPTPRPGCGTGGLSVRVPG